MRKIVKRIARTDPAFAGIIKASPLCDIGMKRSGRGHYQTLVQSILSQQLATKAAATISERVRLLCGGKITPETISGVEIDQLRAAGVSGAKTRAILELTDATINKDLHFSKYPRMSNSEIAEELTALWGVGRWTVEMFLMFHLGRLDLWPVGDLGVRRGWEKLHQLPQQITPEELDLLGNQFTGHQSIVAWYCWRALEGDSSTW
jgi:DNA-3-methyladenine glycosylase II